MTLVADAQDQRVLVSLYRTLASAQTASLYLDSSVSGSIGSPANMSNVTLAGLDLAGPYTAPNKLPLPAASAQSPISQRMILLTLVNGVRCVLMAWRLPRA